MHVYLIDPNCNFYANQIRKLRFLFLTWGSTQLTGTVKNVKCYENVQGISLFPGVSSISDSQKDVTCDLSMVI